MSGRLRVDVGDLAPGGLRAVEVPEGRRKLLVCNASGRFYAIENRCPHAMIGLERGSLRGHALECPLHGGRLDVRDGSPLGLPIRRPVATFDVVPVPGRDDCIEIDLGAPARPTGEPACTTC